MNCNSLPEFEEVSDEEFVNNLRLAAESFIPESDADFEINNENYSKAIVIMALLRQLCDPEYDTIYPTNIVPHNKRCNIEVDFQCLSLSDKSLEVFKKILELSDIVGFDVMDDKIHAEFDVKNVYENKN